MKGIFVYLFLLSDTYWPYIFRTQYELLIEVMILERSRVGCHVYGLARDNLVVDLEEYKLHAVEI